MAGSTTSTVRSRRRNYWEAIYSPDLADKLTAGDWRLPELGANQKVFDSKDLKELVASREVKLDFARIRFVDCDFTGFFTEFGRAIVFKDCQFQRCDFGSSTWERAKFTACTMRQCSITQSSWTDCEFRRCTWTDISMAGNETALTRVYVDNPEAFIDAAYTNLDPDELKRRNVDPAFQRTRLEETKATVARSLYQSHREVGDDITFHKVCKVFTLQGIKARRTSLQFDRANHAKRLGRFLLSAKSVITFVELQLTRAFGAANSWGLSLARPLGMLILTFLAFWIINRVTLDSSWTSAGLRAFDVTSVAGYTKAVSGGSPVGAQLLAAINLAIALFAYTVFFSTAVAKVSRFR